MNDSGCTRAMIDKIDALKGEPWRLKTVLPKKQKVATGQSAIVRLLKYDMIERVGTGLYQAKAEKLADAYYKHLAKPGREIDAPIPAGPAPTTDDDGLQVRGPFYFVTIEGKPHIAFPMGDWNEIEQNRRKIL